MFFKVALLIFIIYTIGFFYYMNIVEPKISYVKEYTEEELKKVLMIKVKVIAWFIYFKDIKNYKP